MTIPRSDFVATQMWGKLIHHFVSGCPRGKHLHFFTLVDYSFTGREAVDFMVQEIPKILNLHKLITRENCTKLLQKFLEERHFYRHDGKEMEFMDNGTLYCFYSVQKPPTPKLIRRAGPL